MPPYTSIVMVSAAAASLQQRSRGSRGGSGGSGGHHQDHHQGGQQQRRRSILDNWNYYRCNIVLPFVFISFVIVHHSSYITNIHNYVLLRNSQYENGSVVVVVGGGGGNHDRDPPPNKLLKEKKKNLLLTAFITDSKKECGDQCRATTEALKMGTECAARTMGSQWEAMAVTDIDKFELEHRHGGNASTTTKPSEWVFPHYVKIHILERLLLADTVVYHDHDHPTNNKVEKEGENTIDNDNANDDYDHDDLDWIGWLDSDVRIVNASYPVSRLLDGSNIYVRAPYYGNQVDEEGHDGNVNKSSSTIDDNDNGVSLIVMSQYNYDNIINNMFFLKNNMWGRRFLLAWKHFTLNAENDYGKWKTCGYYDQCPFGVAMLQVAQDYHWMRQQQQQPSTSTSKLEWEQNWLQSRHYNTTLEDLAFRSGANIQNTLFKEELARLTSSQSNNYWKDANLPLQIGPILLIPTWEGGLRLPSTTTSSSASNSQHDGYVNNKEEDSSSNNKYDLVLSSLTNEPTSLFEKIHNQSPWPFAIHAKYSNLFCHREAKYFFDFELKYKAIHRDQCTSTELSSMWNDSASCWAKWQKSVRSTD